MIKTIAAPAGQACQHIEMTAAEVTARQAEEAAAAAAAPRLAILAEIAALEVQQTPRRIREAVLGLDGGWLSSIGSEIETLREQL